MLYLAQKVRDPYLLALAHVRVGWVLYLLGELVLARTHLEQAALYKAETHPHITLGMTNPRLNQTTEHSYTLRSGPLRVSF